VAGVDYSGNGGKVGNRNPYDICTWKQGAECSGCDLRFELGCRVDKRVFQFFTVSQIPNLALSVFGLVLVGVVTRTWWPLIAFGAACTVLWGLGLETRVLCSHCPFWAEESKTLHFLCALREFLLPAQSSFACQGGCLPGT
jgi:hypothetical protein